MNSTLVHTVILIAVSLPYCINLGTSSIWDANEAFYAETPREMLDSGNYVAPYFNFQPRAQKPPLTYWAILLSYKVFGVNEFAVRLPSALAALGTILFSYGMARILFSRSAGLLAAVITATTARVFILARRLPIDILLLFFLTGTLFFVVRAIQKNERRRWVLAYVFAALGFLTKGPVAVLIPVCAYVLWMLWRRQWRLSAAYPVMGAAVFVCLVLPWYLRVYADYGWTYISPFFLRDNLGRFATQSLGPSRSILYYLSVYATDFFPWSFLVLLSVYCLWRLRKDERPLRSLSFGLPLFWCAFVFAFFSFSKNKQEYYIAPIYPVAAVILSGILDRFLTGAAKESTSLSGWGHPSLQRIWIWVHAALAVVLLFFSLVLPYVFSSFMPNLPPVLHYGPTLVLVLGFAWQVWTLFGRNCARRLSAVAIPLWIIYLLCAVLYLPALEQFRPVKGFCRIIEAQSSGDDEAGVFGTALPSVVYYLRRPIFEENSPEQMLQRFRSGKRVFCILYRKDFGYFAGRKDLDVHILDRHSHFAVRFGALLNAGYLPGEELLLVSNRPDSRINSGRSGPVS